MRITLKSKPSIQSAERWLRKNPTSDHKGPDRGQLDTYRERVLLREGESASGAFERVRKMLLNYDIFPPNLVASRIYPEAQITDGCIVVQRLRLGLLCLESATWVIDVWDIHDPDYSSRAGFTYVTLQGHPERGVETFEVRQEDESVFVVIMAKSVPGNRLTTLAKPIVRIIQRGITKRAVKRLVSDAQ